MISAFLLGILPLVLIVFCIGTGAVSAASGRPPLGDTPLRRFPSLVLLGASAVPALSSQFFYLYRQPPAVLFSRVREDFGEGHCTYVSTYNVSSMPCHYDGAAMGMYHGGVGATSGFALMSTFLTPCNDEYKVIRGMSAMMGVATAGIVVCLWLVMFVRSLLVAGVACLVPVALVSTVLGLSTRLMTGPDFCGSGRSLQQLGFEYDDGHKALIATVVMMSVGGVVIPLCVGAYWCWLDADRTVVESPPHSHPPFGGANDSDGAQASHRTTRTDMRSVGGRAAMHGRDAPEESSDEVVMATIIDNDVAAFAPVPGIVVMARPSTAASHRGVHSAEV